MTNFCADTFIQKQHIVKVVAHHVSHRAGAVMSDVFHLGLTKADLQGALK